MRDLKRNKVMVLSLACLLLAALFASVDLGRGLTTPLFEPSSVYPDVAGDSWNSCRGLPVVGFRAR